jgi:hypothetical protein
MQKCIFPISSRVLFYNFWAFWRQFAVKIPEPVELADFLHRHATNKLTSLQYLRSAMYGVCIGKRHKLKYNSDTINVG